MHLDCQARATVRLCKCNRELGAARSKLRGYNVENIEEKKKQVERDSNSVLDCRRLTNSIIIIIAPAYSQSLTVISRKQPSDQRRCEH